jgi:hypothetical protein
MVRDGKLNARIILNESGKPHYYVFLVNENREIITQLSIIKKVIYLIGIDHQVQHAKNIDIAKLFSSYLEKKVTDLNVDIIAEEWFEELLEMNNVTSTIPQDIAKKFKIKHIFCDPNKQERERIGWKTKADNHLREKYWLDKIKNSSQKNIIFICGSEHLESFKKLIITEGYRAEILPDKFDLL